jgi:hypothetical protein
MRPQLAGFAGCSRECDVEIFGRSKRGARARPRLRVTRVGDKSAFCSGASYISGEVQGCLQGSLCICLYRGTFHRPAHDVQICWIGCEL